MSRRRRDDWRLAAKLVLRTWRPRTRYELGTVCWTVAGSAMVVVATALVLAQLAAYGARVDVLEARTPVLTDGPGPWVAESAVDVGTGELVLVRLGPADPSVGLPPGLARWPAEGEVVVSPAVRDAATSNAFVAELVRGTPMGSVAAGGLRDPEELVAYLGVSEREAKQHGGVRISGFGGKDGVVEDLRAGELRMMALWSLAIVVAGAAALVLVLGRLAAVGKERRFAVLRLLGAPEHAVRVVTGASAALAAMLGALVGVALAGPTIRATGAVPFVAVGRWPVDLTSMLPTLLAVALVVTGTVGVLAARSAGADPWTIRRRGADARLSMWRVLPLASAVLVVGAVAVAQHERSGTGAATPANGVWLLAGGLILAWWGLILVGPLAIRGSATIGRRGSLALRVAAARTDHHARATSRLAAALVSLMLVIGVAGGVAASATDQGDPWRLIELDGPTNYSDPSALRGALAEAMSMPGVEEAIVTRASTRDEPLRTASDVRRGDFGYRLVVSDESLAPVAAAIVTALPESADYLVAGYPAADRKVTMTASITVLAMVLCLLILAVALGLSVAALQAERDDADRALLASGMGRNRLRTVRGAEVALATLPGPLLAALVGGLVAVAASRIDDVDVPVPTNVLAGLVLAPLVCTLALAAVSAVLTPRVSEVARRRE